MQSCLSNCSIYSNKAGEGGGMYNFNSSPTITNCTFSSNEGHGMFNEGSYYGTCIPIITGCTFYNNKRDIFGLPDGGAIYNLLCGQ
jgi:hypothetical protein